MNPLVHALVRQLATLQAESVASGNEEVGASLENLIRLMKSGAAPKAEAHAKSDPLNSDDSVPASQAVAEASNTAETSVGVATSDTDVPAEGPRSPGFAAAASSRENNRSGASQTAPMIELQEKTAEQPPLPSSSPKSSTPTSGATASF